MQEQFIFGIHPVLEALAEAKEIDKILIMKGLKNDNLHIILRESKKAGLFVQFVPIEKLNRITRKNHQGVIALTSNVEYQNIENILPMIYDKGETPFIIILDRITDVRNMGAIARTAECTGVHAILIPAQNSAQINGDAVKASAGAILRMPIAKSLNLKNDINLLKNSGLQIIAVTEKAEISYTAQNYTLPTAIIMGSEEDGISEEYLKLCDHKAKIPMVGEIASLNVSVASGVVLYEALNQKLKA
jgi:23S rRNA (guanosine2251-2'-O)-methyltransferase